MYRPGGVTSYASNETLEKSQYQYDSNDSESSRESLFSPDTKATTGFSGKSIDNQSSVESNDYSYTPDHDDRKLIHVESRDDGASVAAFQMHSDLLSTDIKELGQGAFVSQNSLQRKDPNLLVDHAVANQDSNLDYPASVSKRPDIMPKKWKLDDFLKTPDQRPRSSIPQRLSWEEFARQGVLAAYCSRLNPYALHAGEYELLRSHITQPQVTSYLIIRNAILRLWHRNPLIPITRADAAGCTRDSRHLALSQVAFQWLVRNSYVNFGCIDVPSPLTTETRPRAGKRKTIVVIGAGLSGLGCARQLDNLFMQLEDVLLKSGQHPPAVIILEGRSRIGGRVFSHPLKEAGEVKLPDGARSTAEMGAQIVTGWEHGNPLNVIVRGQLGLPYHTLREASPLYDFDGSLVEKSQDLKIEELWNYILERVAVFRSELPTVQTVEGDKTLINFFEEPKEASEAQPMIADLEKRGLSITIKDGNAVSLNAVTGQNSTVGVEKIAGRQYQHAKGTGNLRAAQAAVNIGWQLQPGVDISRDIDLIPLSIRSEYPTLGETMDEGIRQFQNIISLTPKDLRLLNWHHANLEYANATNVNDLSLGGWDQDVGNEFEGPHSGIIGGYSQVPRGLWKLPAPLDIRFNHVVKGIRYRYTERNDMATVDCENGERIMADKVVFTAPLGVLKDGKIFFSPPLPQWKSDCINRMGFGLLNKVVLLYKESFWDDGQDMFGLLNQNQSDSLDQNDYGPGRGRFYFFWNISKTAGQPALVALMAGDSAHDVEECDDASLIKEATARLAKTFASKDVPMPVQSIVTRWGKDRFARGTYSYVGAKTRIGDYDIMAQPVGPIVFAGEATCGTHPATVHGAYLSGLRAAAEVVDSLIGPIAITETPLVPLKSKGESATPKPTPKKPGYVHVWEPINKPDIFTTTIMETKRKSLEVEIEEAIVAAIGDRPQTPNKTKLNPYILYASDHWNRCKEDMETRLRAKLGQPDAKISRHDVRAALGEEWRNASEAIQKPYKDKCQNGRDMTNETLSKYKEDLRLWEAKAKGIRNDYLRIHLPPAETAAGADATSSPLV